MAMRSACGAGATGVAGILFFFIASSSVPFRVVSRILDHRASGAEHSAPEHHANSDPRRVIYILYSKARLSRFFFGPSYAIAHNMEEARWAGTQSVGRALSSR